MPIFLDTRGLSKVAISVCGRCGCKIPYVDLVEDPNYPGLFVCQEDRDQLDPWRLSPRPDDDLTLEHPRPDVDISGVGPTLLYTSQAINPIIDGVPLLPAPITALGPTRPWQPDTWYNVGEVVTPQSVDDLAVDLPQAWFVVLRAGLSGDTPPDWAQLSGAIVREEG